MTLEVNKGLCL